MNDLWIYGIEDGAWELQSPDDCRKANAPRETFAGPVLVEAGTSGETLWPAQVPKDVVEKDTIDEAGMSLMAQSAWGATFVALAPWGALLASMAAAAAFSSLARRASAEQPGSGYLALA